MKGARFYVLGTTTVLLVPVLIYLFSFPVVYWSLTEAPNWRLNRITHIYGPALKLARHCPPYRAILEYERELLGIPPGMYRY